MALVSIANLALSFGNDPILTGVNLTLDEAEHVGLVGRNGCGKSTLMKLIAGLTTARPDAGQIQIARNASVGYLHQDPTLDPKLTLRQEAGRAFAELYKLHDELEKIAHAMADASPDELDKLMKRYERVEHQMDAAGGYAVDHRIDETLHGLGLGDDTFSVPVTALSGGQKGRLALAKLLLSEPDLLLLDEPTNHLDIAGRHWLEAFLASYRGAVMLVSHDRWLLNQSVSKIYELELGQLVEYPGNYDKFRELRAERRLAQQRVYEKQQDRVKQEQAFIDRYRAGQRARQAQGREKRLERYKRSELVDRPMDQDSMALRFAPATRTGDVVAQATGLTMRYDDLTLFEDLDLTIKRGERIGIIGPNGAGKSTLVRCLLGEQAPTAGAAKLGAQVDVGHYHQTHEHLNPELTVIEHLRAAVPSLSEQESRDLAGAFLFSNDEQDKLLGTLSGGERSRAVLAALMAGGHNVLVLDEPTNHLDIPSAERLEEAIRQFTAAPEGWGQNRAGGGTLILITHDRMLLENLVDQLVIFDEHGCGVTVFTDRYSEWERQQDARAARQGASGTTSPGGAKPAQQSKSTVPQRKAAIATAPRNGGGGGGGGDGSGGGGRFSHMSQAKLESRIEAIEKELAEVDATLADPAMARDGQRVKALQARRQELQAELEPLEAEWSRRA
ncbi:MAG: ABC-F family ATP-binding cassette domain-containing protein [Phycisphaeraceae bacterium]